MKTKIVAEIGECFNGEILKAKELITVAKEAECDIVKFQLLDLEEVASDDPEYDWFAKLELNEKKIKEIVTFSEMVGIEILFTPVSIKTAKMIKKMNISTVKIASSFIRKKELLKYIGDNFQTIYISTGMATLNEIADIVNYFHKKNREIILFHCISEYPTGPLLEERGLCALDEKDAHLNMMVMLKRSYPNISVGYSDHTNNIFVPMLATAMGADIIEKHITLDRETPVRNFDNGKEYMGTDHVLSLEPEELKDMVKGIRRVEKIMGNDRWERSEGEKTLRDFLRGRYSEQEK